MEKVIADNFLCFYALLEMILRDVGIKKYTQYDLADLFGVTVPIGYKIDKIQNLSESNNDKELGAHISEQILNSFFDGNQIPLSSYFVPANPFEEYPESVDGYYIYALSYGSLYHRNELVDIGHVVLKIEQKSERTISVYDPGPKNAGIKLMDVLDIYDAIYKGKGGVYVIKRK